jgi:hypothetical protein
MKYAGGKLHIAVFNKKSWGGPLGEFVNLSPSFIFPTTVFTMRLLTRPPFFCLVQTFF